MKKSVRSFAWRIFFMLPAIVPGFSGCDSSESIQKRDAALTKVIQKGMVEASIPGIIVGIWKEGSPPYVHAFGISDSATKQPMSTNLYMRIGSVTKTFTVTALLQLAGEGKIGLDDPVEKYVAGVPRGNEITLRQLAAMRSGLYDYATVIIPKLGQDPNHQWTIKELLDTSFAHPLLFSPGTSFDYCNTNTILLGLVIEKASGEPIHTYIDKHILKPAGMTHTFFPADTAFPSPHSQGYTKLPDNSIVNSTNWNPSWGGAAGQMISNLDDLQKWTYDLAEGRLISPALKRQRDQFLPAPGEGQGVMYGLGLENDNGWIGHNGNITGYLTFAFYLPAEKTTMVILINSSVDLPATAALVREVTRIISPNNIWPEPPEF